MSTSRQQPDAINYLWIGPPAVRKGQDTDGPFQMAAQNSTNPIKFWCLPEYKEHYKELLGDKIEVLSIDDLTNSIEKNPNMSNSIKEALKKFNHVKATLQDPKRKDAKKENKDSPEADARSSTRDRVTLKNFFSLLVLLANGGYVMDSNVEPVTRKKIALPSYDTFMYPEYIAFDYVNNCVIEQPEIWMMYNPPSNKEFITEVFRGYFDAFLSNEERFAREGYTEEYHLNTGGIVKLIRDYGDSTKSWEAIGLLDPFRPTIAELHLSKQYNNTHKVHSAEQFHTQGKAAFQNKDYTKALELVSTAIRRSNNQAQCAEFQDTLHAFFSQITPSVLQNNLFLVTLQIIPEEWRTPETNKLFHQNPNKFLAYKDFSKQNFARFLLGQLPETCNESNSYEFLFALRVYDSFLKNDPLKSLTTIRNAGNAMNRYSAYLESIANTEQALIFTKKVIDLYTEAYNNGKNTTQLFAEIPKKKSRLYRPYA